ncbi:MAG: exosortase H [Phycisphaerae bacterium]
MARPLLRSKHTSRSAERSRGGGSAAEARFRRPVLRFMTLFVVFVGAFYAVNLTPVFEDHVWPWYLRVNARMSGDLLRGLGEPVTVAGRRISSVRGGLSIERGCDALQPSALFIAAVLAFPASMWKRIPGLLVGTLVLMVINLVRIVSLYYVQVFWPGAFEIMHVEVWQALFIFLALLFWVFWARWATRRPAVTADATN